ncbi:hypothetical protein [Psychrobacter aquimaris]|uniref:hypothetical protein n=3 Tax=Psychrobacter aquimaris TaxID=292733 RepID=UPI0018E00C6E|nr:hypothetical protein [Psychrobacter aquimaris]
MNNGDVFQKTDLGREEIKSQSLGILPREARTLLIMIDGKRTYQSYLDTLDHSKMFADFGGIAPLFELLLGLECIEIAGAASQTSTAPQAPTASQPQSSLPSFEQNIETEFDRTFNNKSPNKMAALGKKSLSSIFKTKLSGANYETIKSELANYIEKNAPRVEAWGYLLSLEQCGNSSQLLSLVKEIQSTSGSNLSHGMSEFIKKIQR